MVGETLQPQSRQLEFEDVWLASQVEPLQDNFDVLGRSSDEISEGKVSKETVVPCRWGEGRGGLTKYLVIVLIGHRKRGSKADVSSVSPLSERKDDGRSKSQLKKKLFTVVNFHYQLSL